MPIGSDIFNPEGTEDLITESILLLRHGGHIACWLTAGQAGYDEVIFLAQQQRRLCE